MSSSAACGRPSTASTTWRTPSTATPTAVCAPTSRHGGRACPSAPRREADAMDFFDSVFADQNRERRDRTMQGVAVAHVTGRMEDGTYELRYLGMGGNAPSAPARMMMPNAGASRGMHWMPE